jgi:phosphatidylserine decarboxylase
LKSIQFYNRGTRTIETEAIYGETALRLAYENPVGRGVLELLVKRGIFSRWYGWRMDLAGSREKVLPFIAKYGLNPAEFAEKPETFKTFNEFFYRKLKPGARPIHSDANSVVFPADGRHLGFQDISQSDGFFVKGQQFNMESFLGDSALGERYRRGTFVLSRLCPVDYHRFHFPVGGIPRKPRLINGPLYSVSPIALGKRLAYLWKNKRVVTQVETERLGTVLIVEIGATNVGSIHQTYTPGIPMDKGAEKGYFAFGGSSTVTIFEPGKVTLDEDLLAQSALPRELYAKMGEHLGVIG